MPALAIFNGFGDVHKYIVHNNSSYASLQLTAPQNALSVDFFNGFSSFNCRFLFSSNTGFVLFGRNLWFEISKAKWREKIYIPISKQRITLCTQIGLLINRHFIRRPVLLKQMTMELWWVSNSICPLSFTVVSFQTNPVIITISFIYCFIIAIMKQIRKFIYKFSRI